MIEALRSIRAENPSPMTLDGTRTYVVGRTRSVVIDPGPAIPTHIKSLETALGSGATLAILLTHRHPDHAAAAAAIRSSSGAPVVAGRPGHGQEGDQVRVDEYLEDGQVFETDAGAVTAMAAPGHTPDHYVFCWDGADARGKDRALFAGDLLLGEGDTALVAAPEGDVASYLETLECVRQYHPTVIYPAHGPPITHPERAIDAYRDHRLARVRQTLEALRTVGRAAASRLIDAVYGAGLDPRIRWAAEASLQATLEYLARTGRALRCEDGSFIAVASPDQENDEAR